jgi:hypothetical protein
MISPYIKEVLSAIHIYEVPCPLLYRVSRDAANLGLVATIRGLILGFCTCTFADAFTFLLLRIIGTWNAKMGDWQSGGVSDRRGSGCI